MPDRRVRTALRDALNGDAETVDPPVRRALLVLAVAQDDADDRHEKLEASFREVVDTVDALRKAVYGATATIVTSFAAAAAAIISRL